MRIASGAIVVSWLATLGTTGCARSAAIVPDNTTTHASLNRSQVPFGSATDIEEYMRQHETNHVVGNIQVIHRGNLDGHGYAFASFSLDGNPEYANIVGSKQGAGMGIYSVDQEKTNPLPYVSQIADDGFVEVTGSVGNEAVKIVLLVFGTGQVKQVPVTNGLFWFAGRVGTSGKSANPTKVIGITKQGTIVFSR